MTAVDRIVFFLFQTLVSQVCVARFGQVRKFICSYTESEFFTLFLIPEKETCSRSTGFGGGGKGGEYE